MKSRECVSIDRVTQLLDYDKNTGLFMWRVSTGNRKSGDMAGYLNKSNGYIHLRIDGHLYKAHRIAWLYEYGSWPINVIDHKNGVKTDNRISNLSDVTVSENLQNVGGAFTSNKTGLLGVCFHKKTNKWRAQITVDGKRRHIGYFHTPDDAYNAYLEKKASVHVNSNRLKNEMREVKP